MATAKNNGSAAAKQRRIKEYEQAPKRCAYCDKPLSYDERSNTYCNASCAAKANNPQRKQSVVRKCKECGREFTLRTPSEKKTFCSSACSGRHRQREKIARWLEGGTLSISVSGQISSSTIKKYLMEEQDRCCAICSAPAEHNGKPLVFVLDHIDGDSTYNERSNLRLICPNCDSQTDTYKARNRGKGRRSRGFAANVGL
jgi:endogenous inhibitor of DNA gyrase (YacG/DUF329 family)